MMGIKESSLSNDRFDKCLISVQQMNVMRRNDDATRHHCWFQKKQSFLQLYENLEYTQKYSL
jgi:hypothetical protein